MIYLDYAANHPADPAVLARFCEVERNFPGNPNAAHPAGQAARGELDRVTDSIAARLGVRPLEVYYTAGATESNRIAIRSLVQKADCPGGRILASPLEHPSVERELDLLRNQGYRVERLKLSRSGKVDLEDLRTRMGEDVLLLAIAAVDSELGTVQPLEEIKALLPDYPRCRLHVDATQAMGHIPVTFAGTDTMSAAPHKFGGLNGIGLLLAREEIPLCAAPGGTPALALAASAELALRLALERREERFRSIQALNAGLRSALSAHPGVRINSPENAVPHILNLSVEGVRGGRFQRALAERGICVSVRSACVSGGEPSPAVLAVTGDQRNALSSWRISLSYLTTRDELDEFLLVFEDVCRELRG